MGLFEFPILMIISELSSIQYISYINLFMKFCFDLQKLI